MLQLKFEIQNWGILMMMFSDKKEICLKWHLILDCVSSFTSLSYRNLQADKIFFS